MRIRGGKCRLAALQVGFEDHHAQTVKGVADVVHVWVGCGDSTIDDQESRCAGGDGGSDGGESSCAGGSGLLGPGAEIEACMELPLSEAAENARPTLCTLPHNRRREMARVWQLLDHGSPAACEFSGGVAGFVHLMALGAGWDSEVRRALRDLERLQAVAVAKEVVVTISGPFRDVVKAWISKVQLRGGLDKARVVLQEDYRGLTFLAYQHRHLTAVRSFCLANPSSIVWAATAGTYMSPHRPERRFALPDRQIPS